MRPLTLRHAACGYASCTRIVEYIGAPIALVTIGWAVEPQGTAWCPLHRRDAQSNEGRDQLEQRTELLQGVLADSLRFLNVIVERAAEDRNR